jgi:hypothetical protein
VLAGIARVYSVRRITRRRPRDPRLTLAFPKPDHDEHEPRTERYTAGPSGDGALLLHFPFDVTEL